MIDLNDGMTFCEEDFTGNVRIRNAVSGDHQSTEWTITGPGVNASNIDNSVNYQSDAFALSAGTYTVTSTLYSEDGATGLSCDEETMSFTVESCAAGLGNFTFEDLNNNGMFDAEDSPIGGIAVTLYDAADLNTPMASTTTDNAGFYQFIDLDPELDYVVEFGEAADFTRSTPVFPSSNGDEDKNDADATGFTDVIDLDPGEFDPTIDAGYVPAPILALSLIHI